MPDNSIHNDFLWWFFGMGLNRRRLNCQLWHFLCCSIKRFTLGLLPPINARNYRCHTLILCLIGMRHHFGLVRESETSYSTCVLSSFTNNFLLSSTHLSENSLILYALFIKPSFYGYTSIITTPTIHKEKITSSWNHVGKSNITQKSKYILNLPGHSIPISHPPSNFFPWPLHIHKSLLYWVAGKIHPPNNPLLFNEFPVVGFTTKHYTTSFTSNQ